MSIGLHPRVGIPKHARVHRGQVGSCTKRIGGSFSPSLTATSRRRRELGFPSLSAVQPSDDRRYDLPDVSPALYWRTMRSSPGPSKPNSVHLPMKSGLMFPILQVTHDRLDAIDSLVSKRHDYGTRANRLIMQWPPFPRSRKVSVNATAVLSFDQSVYGNPIQSCFIPERPQRAAARWHLFEDR